MALAGLVVKLGFQLRDSLLRVALERVVGIFPLLVILVHSLELTVQVLALPLFQ